MFAFSFTARVMHPGYRLTDSRGVTVGYVTMNTKDDLTRFFVSGPSGPTYSLGFTRTGF